MIRYRLGLLSKPQRALRASAASLPFPSESFDVVVSIGCLHHTGQLEACVAEVHRVLRPEGTAMVMVYNQFSYRRWMRSPVALLQAWRDERVAPPRDRRGDEQQRRMYDANQQGEAAPETVFVSERRARDLFRRFGAVAVAKENCDDIVRGGRHLRLRERLLTTIGPRAGLDLYITARK